MLFKKKKSHKEKFLVYRKFSVKKETLICEVDSKSKAIEKIEECLKVSPGHVYTIKTIYTGR